jgi:hypothetical protein
MLLPASGSITTACNYSKHRRHLLSRMVTQPKIGTSTLAKHPTGDAKNPTKRRLLKD